MEISLLELGWRVGLYTKRKYREHVTLNGLSRAETVKASHLLMEFWPSIGDGGFNVGNTKVESIKDPKVKLAHRCIATTISGRKESTNRVTKIDLYYLYCIYTEGVVYNIPYWLEKYLRTVKEDDEAEEEAGGEAANEGAGDERWERFDAWRGQHEALANWIYDHTVHELQYLSTPGVKPITLPMATIYTCLQAMHIVLAYPMMALLDYPCLIMEIEEQSNQGLGDLFESELEKCWKIQQKRNDSHSNLRRQARDDALRKWEAQIDQLRREEHEGIVENVLVKIDKFSFTSDFVIIDTKELNSKTIILGRPFLANIRAKINISTREVSLGIKEDRVKIKMKEQECNMVVGERLNKRPTSQAKLSHGAVNKIHWCEPVYQEHEKGYTLWASSDPHHEICDEGGIPNKKLKHYWKSTNDNDRINIEWEGLSCTN
ncbi:zinc finger, CCHC-type containing protein [Tanacetum coccineum]|uniref:Zinc finger, CCHC-type containing protein n=1 Tax=Tanacetum coccineum TaxID=301880 RepID=A0ABQ4YV90_9ASTR